MRRVQASIVIRAPLVKVWNYYTDVDRLKDWIPGGNIVKFEWLSPSMKRVGARYRFISGCREDIHIDSGDDRDSGK